MNESQLKYFREYYPEYNDLDDITLIKAFRGKYPEYKDLSDNQLVMGIEGKYGDITKQRTIQQPVQQVPTQQLNQPAGVEEWRKRAGMERAVSKAYNQINKQPSQQPYTPELTYDVEKAREQTFLTQPGWEGRRREQKDLFRIKPLEQAMYGYTSGMTGGLAPALTTREERQQMQPKTTGEFVGRGVGELAGFVQGAPMKIAKGIVGKVLPKVASPILKQAATLGLASGIGGNEEVGELLKKGGSQKLVGFLENKLISTGLGALTGARFGIVGKLPKYWERAAANIIVGNIINAGTQKATTGEMPDLRDVVYNSLMDLYFSKDRVPTKKEIAFIEKASKSVSEGLLTNRAEWDKLVKESEKYPDKELSKSLRTAYVQWNFNKELQAEISKQGMAQLSEAEKFAKSKTFEQVKREGQKKLVPATVEQRPEVPPAPSEVIIPEKTKELPPKRETVPVKTKQRPNVPPAPNKVIEQKKPKLLPEKKIEKPQFKTEQDLNDWYSKLSQTEQNKNADFYQNEYKRLTSEKVTSVKNYYTKKGNEQAELKKHIKQLSEVDRLDSIVYNGNGNLLVRQKGEVNYRKIAENVNEKDLSDYLSKKDIDNLLKIKQNESGDRVLFPSKKQFETEQELNDWYMKLSEPEQKNNWDFYQKEYDRLTEGARHVTPKELDQIRAEEEKTVALTKTKKPIQPAPMYVAEEVKPRKRLAGKQPETKEIEYTQARKKYKAIATKLRLGEAGYEEGYVWKFKDKSGNTLYRKEIKEPVVTPKQETKQKTAVTKAEPEKVAPKVETPKEAVKEIIEGKRESHIGTKEFKKLMLAELESAKKKAKSASKDENTEELIKRVGHITIEIPGDGTFKMINTIQEIDRVTKEVKGLKLEGETTKKGLLTPSSPKATRTELGNLKKIEKKGWYSDGKLLIKGEPPKNKKYEGDKHLESVVDNILNTPSKKAKKLYYYVDEIYPEEMKGVSDKPVASGRTKEIFPRVIFESDGKYYTYNQYQFNYLNKKYPNAKYEINEDTGNLFAFQNNEKVAVLTAIAQGEEGIIAHKKPPLEKEAIEAGLLKTKPEKPTVQAKEPELSKTEVKTGTIKIRHYATREYRKEHNRPTSYFRTDKIEKGAETAKSDAWEKEAVNIVDVEVPENKIYRKGLPEIDKLIEKSPDFQNDTQQPYSKWLPSDKKIVQRLKKEGYLGFQYPEGHKYANEVVIFDRRTLNKYKPTVTQPEVSKTETTKKVKSPKKEGGTEKTKSIVEPLTQADIEADKATIKHEAYRRKIKRDLDKKNISYFENAPTKELENLLKTSEKKQYQTIEHYDKDQKTLVSKVIEEKANGDVLVERPDGTRMTVKAEDVKTSKPSKQSLGIVPPKWSETVKFIDAIYERGEFKKETKSYIRSNRGIMDRDVERLYKIRKKVIRFWDKQFKNKDFITDYITLFEEGKIGLIEKKYGKEFGDFAKQYKERLDESYRLTKEDFNEYIENYWPHMWKNPDKANKFWASYVKKFGKPNFAKQRKISLFKLGLDAGLEPLSWNPEEMVIMRETAGWQWLMTKRIMTDFKKNNVVKFFKSERDLRYYPGYTKINHPAFDVYYKRPEKIKLDIQRKGETEGQAKIRIEEGQGFERSGFYAAPEAAAKIINNWLSPTLWSSNTKGGKVFRGLVRAKNVVIVPKLAISFFHGIETSISDIANQVTINAQSLGKSKFRKGINNKVLIPTSVFYDLFKLGHRIKKAYYSNAKPGTMEYEAVEYIKRAGGRPDMAKKYLFDMWDNMSRSFYKGQYGKAGMQLPFALLEGVSKPLMQGMVPRLKVASFYKLAKTRIENAKLKNPELTRLEENKILADTWDLADNRFGQMVYDNLFWNNKTKDILTGASLSLGWNIGTVREFGGAYLDIGKAVLGMAAGRKPEMSQRVIYHLAYAVAMGTLGTILGYAMTGEGPKTVKDLYYPKTGDKNSDGSDERLQLPTMMKEYFSMIEAIRKRGIIKGPVTVAEHKIAPTWSMGAQMLENENYFGIRISDSPTGTWQWAKDYSKFMWDYLQPISRSSSKRMQKRRYLPYIGFSPAPRYVTRSIMQKRIYEAYQSQQGNVTKSKAAGERIRKKAQLREKIKAGKVTGQEIQNAIKEGLIKKDGIMQFYKGAYLDGDQRMFMYLSSEAQRDLMQEMTMDELKRFGPFCNNDVSLNFYIWKKNQPAR